MRVLLVLLTITVLTSVGCSKALKDECGKRFVLLWPNADKEYKFQEVELSTLNSAYEAKGAAAEVFFESRVVDSGFEGSVAHPRLTRAGGVCVPLDTGSSMVLSAYAHFEQIYKFDQEIGADKQITWPRKVGVEIHVTGPDGAGHNNAHYFSRADAVAVIPFTQDGLTLSLNPGVLAHEHFHAHFQSQVIHPLNDAIDVLTSVEDLFYKGFGLKPSVEDLDNVNAQTIEGLNKFVVRGWNEGLADFYGATFYGQSDFFSPSWIAPSKLPSARDLSGPLGVLMDGQTIMQQTANTPLLIKNMVGFSYQQGTVLARLLYRIALSGAVPPREVLKHVMNRLNRLPSIIAPSFRRRVLDGDEIVPSLLEGLALNSAACDALRTTVSKSQSLRSFQSCVR